MIKDFIYGSGRSFDNDFRAQEVQGPGFYSQPDAVGLWWRRWDRIQGILMSLPQPFLKATVSVPSMLCSTQTFLEGEIVFGGDIRVGNLRGTGALDFLVYRSVGNAHDGGGMKPCFLGAFTEQGKVIWSVGSGGEQPCRPGPVGIHDIDGDGKVEVICFFQDGSSGVDPTSMADVVIQIRAGATGEVKQQAAPKELRSCSGRGPNWCHQRLLFADLRGSGAARDFVVKLGAQLLAFDCDLNFLWGYLSPWTDYKHCPAYIPAVGDLDGDGRDEVFGGYFLLDHDGRVIWEGDIAPNMDSVAITEWDQGRVRAIGSGHGIVMDEDARVLLNLGDNIVPHGQELRVARFDDKNSEPQMVIRYDGHKTGLVVADTSGEILNRFEVNFSPNNTGMESVYWQGRDRAALLQNGGMLWNPLTAEGTALPGLPVPKPKARMAWYHCIPIRRQDNGADDFILYNPWSDKIWIYSFSSPVLPTAYESDPRQYNPRIMD